MSFSELTSSISAQLAVVLASPVPFLIVLVIVSLGMWKVAGWHFKGRLDDQESRLRLRDDEIAHLKRLAEHQATIAADVQLTATRDIDSPSNTSIIINEVPDVHGDYTLPWQVFVRPEERQFVDFDEVKPLVASGSEMTSARRAALAQPFLKKWVKISVLILDVDVRSEETCISSHLGDDGFTVLWMHFTRDREHLVHLARGDEITLVGWIEEVRTSGVRLYGCERITP